MHWLHRHRRSFRVVVLRVDFCHRKMCSTALFHNKVSTSHLKKRLKKMRHFHNEFTSFKASSRMDAITPCLCSKDFVYRHNGVQQLVYHYHKENKTILDGPSLKPPIGELEVIGRIEIRGPVNCNIVHN